MKNLEIKLRLDKKPNNLKKYYKETLHQKDTYFVHPNGRLKLREEKGKQAYFIKYNRPDTSQQKISNYYCYPVENVQKFFDVFGDVLIKEIEVRKTRELYLIKNARVHVDTVEGLGLFMEIEVVIKTDEEEKSADALLRKILKRTGTENNCRVNVGYRELLLGSSINFTDFLQEF